MEIEEDKADAAEVHPGEQKESNKANTGKYMKTYIWHINQHSEAIDLLFSLIEQWTWLIMNYRFSHK